MTDLEFLFGAIKIGDREKVGTIVNDNPKIVFSKDFKQNATALHIAALNDFRDAAELLLAKKADTNARDSLGFTPLHYAAAKGHMNMVELLLANGADINAKNIHGQTAFQIATRNARKGIAEWMAIQSLPSLTIKVFDDSGAKLYHEKTSILTLEALRSEILQGIIPKDSKTVFVTKIGNNKPNIIEGKLIKISTRYPILAKLYRPMRFYARSGVTWGIFAGFTFGAINLGIAYLIAQPDQPTGLLIIAMPVCFAIFLIMTYMKRTPPLLIQIAAFIPLFLGKVNFTLWGAVCAGALLFSMPGMTIGAIVGAIRRPRIRQAPDAVRENALVYISVPLVIGIMLWTADIFWVRHYFHLN